MGRLEKGTKHVADHMCTRCSSGVWWNWALQEYTQVVTYTKLHPQALEHFGQETEICQQMMELLPTKIEALMLGRLIPMHGV